MKIFQFSLEQILGLRHEEELEAEVRLGRAVSEWNRLNQDKQDREGKKKRISPGRSPDDIRQTSLYLSRLDQEIVRFQSQMNQREPELERLREEYRQARAAREGLDKLKEKRRDEYHKKAVHREALALDDLSMSMTRARNSSE